MEGPSSVTIHKCKSGPFLDPTPKTVTAENEKLFLFLLFSQRRQHQNSFGRIGVNQFTQSVFIPLCANCHTHDYRKCIYLQGAAADVTEGIMW